MAKWTQHKFKLDANHKWKSKPGYNIFVANWGAVRFDVPRDWFPIPGKSFKFHDLEPPNDNCVLECSIMQFPPTDWSELPLAEMFGEVLRGGYQRVISHGEIHHEQRAGFQLVWTETRYVDEAEDREAHARACVGLHESVQTFITLAYWPEDAERFTPVWDEVLRTLQLARPDRNLRG